MYRLSVIFFSYHKIIFILDEGTPCETGPEQRCVREASDCTESETAASTSNDNFACCSDEFQYCCVPAN